jgi:hypothetical protein
VYSIQICVLNGIGAGPKTDTILAATKQDGKIITNVNHHKFLEAVTGIVAFSYGYITIYFDVKIKEVFIGYRRIYIGIFW